MQDTFRFTAFPLLVAVFMAFASAARGDDRPNVIVVLTDDQGYGDLSCHGNPVLKTPNLDRLHAESIRLTDFHVAPMCTPTRGQLLTGVDCLRNGAMNVSSGRTLLRRNFPTAANLFSAAGYQTGQFGKWHLGDNAPFRPQDRGFQESVWFPSSHIGSAPDFFTNDYFDDTYNHNGKRQAYRGYCTDVFFGEAMTWMKAHAAAKQPFFCYLATNAPHGPLYGPADARKPYADQKPAVARFFGMIANIDENVGRLESFLVESGLRDNTIVIFLTDNGGTAGVPVFNAGMRGRKVELYEGGHRVPCFVRWPRGRLRPPGDVAELAQVQDLLPTLLDLCGISSTATFDGQSLAPILRDPAGHLAERMLVIQFSRMNAPSPAKGDACVLWKRWRLVADKELFDLSTDPLQSKNVLNERPEVVSRLREHYDRWWAGVGPKVNEPEFIVIGSEAENPLLLLSPADWWDVFLDQGQQVREGLRRNGHWNVEVQQPGTYEFTLRRWPVENAAPLTAGFPAIKNTDGEFPAGVVLPIAKARIRVGEFQAEKDSASGEESVRFETALPAGRTELTTAFLAADGREIAGAYYVTARRTAASRE